MGRERTEHGNPMVGTVELLTLCKWHLITCFIIAMYKVTVFTWWNKLNLQYRAKCCQDKDAQRHVKDMLAFTPIHG